ncbi:MAG: LysR substrate-binding domain-containing protein [Rhizobiaceae bacterium]
MSRLLEALPFFVAVAEELNFGRAADRLGMTQPPLSRRIKMLEEVAGVALFRRDRHTVALTPAGERLLDHAREVMAMAGKAAIEIRQVDRGLDGRLRVGFVSSATYGVLPRIVTAFAARHPAVELSFREATTLAQLDLLRKGEIDVGLVRTPASDRHIRTAIILREGLVAAVPAGHRFAGRATMALAELAGENLVMYSSRDIPRLHDTVVKWCREAGFEARVVQEATQISTLTAFAAAGLGVALLPSGAQPPIEGVVYVPIAPALKMDLACAALRAKAGGLGRSFVTIARQACRSMEAAAE